MDDRRRQAILFLIATAFMCERGNAQPQSDSSNRKLVTVNGTDITEAGLNFLVLSRRIPAETAKSRRKQLIEQLVNQRLLLQFLSKRRVKLPKTAVDSQVRRIKELIRRTGDDPKKVLARLGYTEEKLRKELGLPLMWKSYAASIITREQLRKYWKEHKTEFDGSEIRASHIVMKLEDPSDKNQVVDVTKKLNQIRSELKNKKLTFEEAAKKFSESPTKDRGGDLGFSPFRGKMPVSISRVVFALDDGEVSEPFQTKYGIHIATVTGRRPGQLSLEDARISVFERLAEEIRLRLVQQEREKAKISWKTASE